VKRDRSQFDPALLALDDPHSLGHFLAGRGAQSHLVSSPALREALPVDKAGAFTWSQTLDDVPAKARTIHVDSPDAELALLAEARERFPEARVLGLRHHLAPMLATDRKAIKQVPADFSPASLARYAIVCPARSGSTLLGQLLAQSGIGKPKEHLRNPLAAALRSPGVDVAEAWRQVAWRAEVGGVFGSKLVAEFVSAAAGSRGFAALLAELVPEGVPVIALRRPLIDTVVSRWVARKADQWHVRGAMTLEERKRFAAAEYDYDMLHHVLERNRAENRTAEAALDAMAGRPVLRVAYADLDADPMATLERVAGFLGIRPKLDGLNGDRLPIKISAEVDTHRRLAGQFLADLQAHGEALDPEATL
jgi:LPS sulfotransferase NodH